MGKVFVEIRIKDIVRAWDRKLFIDHEDNDGVVTSYVLILHWDDETGFSATWMDSELRFIAPPDWSEPGEEFLVKLSKANDREIIEVES